MERINIQYFESPYGELLLGSHCGKLCLCDWRYRKRRSAIDNRLQAGLGAEYRERDDNLLAAARGQLGEYFEHRRRKFDIPLLLVGTPFQQKVWRRLLDIPFGETSSYLELARALGNRDAVRAVASANGANAISIIVPCHRVIGSNGRLTGYAGGLEAKAGLLGLEFDLFNPPAGEAVSSLAK
jgi:methylated-DNA-[protein]-cysteine S-methyltransferase